MGIYSHAVLDGTCHCDRNEQICLPNKPNTYPCEEAGRGSVGGLQQQRVLLVVVEILRFGCDGNYVVFEMKGYKD
jgi:hypothetical protein